MKLQSLTLKNFRQFYGEQTLEFSTSPQQNVTIIHGENGSGKTSLLNAFKWAFYGETDFDTGNQNIANERAIVESEDGHDIHCLVRVGFEHEGRSYAVTRELYCKKETGLKCHDIGGSNVEVNWTDDSGEFKKANNPETFIDQLVPQKLHSYFFFNGERIEKLANIDSSPEIQKAIKSLMGLEVVERASRHIGSYVISGFKKELKQHSTKETQEVIENENELEERIKDTKERLKVAEDNRRHYQTMRSDLNRRLKEIGEAAALQKRRESAENEVEEWKQRRQDLEKERLQAFSKNGFLAFTDGLVKKTQAILEEKRKKGELPSKIKAQFIDDLLNRKSCICGRPLEEGSDSYGKVSAYMRNATTDDIEDAFIKTSGAVSHMVAERDNLISKTTDFQRREKEIKYEIQKLHEEIDEIDKKFGDSDIEDIVKLETKREETIDKIQEVIQKISELKHKIDIDEKELEEVRKKRKELAAKDKAVETIKQKLELAEEVKKIADALHGALSDSVRRELSKKVNDTFRSILVKDYWAEISEDYTLQIYKNVGGHKHLVSDKSTGESQVSSLSFIGSIVALAKERHGQNAGYYKGGLYPIVMDSPYGNLDPEYREKVAKYIPELAEQVVVMATDSQWRGEVETAVKARKGKEYSLIYHTPTKKGNSNSASILEDTEYEYTEIKEGYNG